jgi:hypothetical protein
MWAAMMKLPLRLRENEVSPLGCLDWPMLTIATKSVWGRSSAGPATKSGWDHNSAISGGIAWCATAIPTTTPPAKRRSVPNRGQPVTLGHMRAHGCRRLLIYCSTGLWPPVRSRDYVQKTGSDGKVTWVEDRNHIANCQFRINALFRIVDLLAPKKYGRRWKRAMVSHVPVLARGSGR